MTKRSVIRCILSVLLTAYLVVGLSYAAQLSDSEPYAGIRVVIKGDNPSEFVTTADIEHELGSLCSDIASLSSDQVNTLAIEQKILTMDNIENAHCVVLNNRLVQVEVEPLVPAARIFDTNAKTNYYINRAGKKMKASNRYRLDAPVVVGPFNDKIRPTDALPVIDHINANPDLNDLVSAIKVTPKGDILLIPRIKGHVVNFGDSTDIKNKFDRLLTFYRKVMPVKGWEFYDTITVKWRGQIVAKKRNPHEKDLPEFLEAEDYIDDPGTMLTQLVEQTL